MVEMLVLLRLVGYLVGISPASISNPQAYVAPIGEFDIQASCDSLGLVDMSHGRVWRCADATTPGTAKLDVHLMGRQSGGTSLKATCKRHRNCVCWLTKACEGAERLAILQDLMVWGSQREASEQYHYALSKGIKEKYRMKVRA